MKKLLLFTIFTLFTIFAAASAGAGTGLKVVGVEIYNVRESTSTQLRFECPVLEDEYRYLVILVNRIAVILTRSSKGIPGVPTAPAKLASDYTLNVPRGDLLYVFRFKVDEEEARYLYHVGVIGVKQTSDDVDCSLKKYEELKIFLDNKRRVRA